MKVCIVCLSYFLVMRVWCFLYQVYIVNDLYVLMIFNIVNDCRKGLEEFVNFGIKVIVVDVFYFFLYFNCWVLQEWCY